MPSAVSTTDARLREYLLLCDRERVLSLCGEELAVRLLRAVIRRVGGAGDQRRLLKLAALTVAFLETARDSLGTDGIEVGSSEERLLEDLLRRLARRRN